MDGVLDMLWDIAAYNKKEKSRLYLTGTCWLVH